MELIQEETKLSENQIYYAKNRDHIIERRRIAADLKRGCPKKQKRTREEYNTWQREYNKKRIESDPAFREKLLSYQAKRDAKRKALPKKEKIVTTIKKTPEEIKLRKKLYMEKYRKENKERLDQQKKDWAELHKDEIVEKRKAKYEKRKEERTQEEWIIIRERYRKQNELFRANNPDKVKEYRNNGREKMREYGLNYRKENSEKISATKKQYKKENPEKFRIAKRNKIATDPLFRLGNSIRCLISMSFRSKGEAKSLKTEQILGCTIPEFRNYLESKFEPWMTWENKGKFKMNVLNYGWDIDHVIPLCTAKTKEEIIKLSHYTNLQPLCSYTNRYIKAGNLIEDLK